MLEQMRQQSRSLLIYLLFSIVIVVFIVNFGPQSIGGCGMRMPNRVTESAARVDGRTLTLKGWNFAERAAKFAPGARLDAAFTLDADDYSRARGYAGWSATLRDVRTAQSLGQE